nr:reverse transcriptase domain-containing protein [Tanacetum cinerariifolium]
MIIEAEIEGHFIQRMTRRTTSSCPSGYRGKNLDMIGVPKLVAEHRLNIREGCPPVKQKGKSQPADRKQAIQEEVEKLVNACIIKEVHYNEKGMFLGYNINTKGIKVCPDKVDVVLSLPSPKCLKDVQKLNGKLASLNRFLAKSAEKSLSFFKTLKKCTKKSDFHYIKEAEAVFKQIKQLIAELPTLTAPKEKEELIVYLATTKEAISAILITEREAKQIPIYFLSHALSGPKVNYTSMEKLVLALVHASKRLKRYFQAHPIIVVADQPIKQLLSRSEVAERLQKWSIELGEYAIHYRPRVSVKGKILADFIVERPEKNDPDTATEFEEELLESFEATNNVAEYEALIAGFRLVEEIGVKNLQANMDSRLVANQVDGTYIVKEANMILYLEKTIRSKTGVKSCATANVFLLTSASKWVCRKNKPKLRGRDQEAVIPAEIGMPILRTAELDMVQTNEALGINLDLLEERRERAAFREA